MQMKVKSCKKTQKIEIEMSQIFFKYLTGQQLLTFERARAFANVYLTPQIAEHLHTPRAKVHLIIIS